MAKVNAANPEKSNSNVGLASVGCSPFNLFLIRWWCAASGSVDVCPASFPWVCPAL